MYIIFIFSVFFLVKRFFKDVYYFYLFFLKCEFISVFCFVWGARGDVNMVVFLRLKTTSYNFFFLVLPFFYLKVCLYYLYLNIILFIGDTYLVLTISKVILWPYHDTNRYKELRINLYSLKSKGFLNRLKSSRIYVCSSRRDVVTVWS